MQGLIWWSRVIAGVVMVGLLANWYLTPQHPYSHLYALHSETSQILTQLAKTKYFRIIRLNLQSKCPLNLFNKICRSKSCHVCRCDKKNIPAEWSTSDRVEAVLRRQEVWQRERSEPSEHQPHNYTVELPSKWVWHVEDIENDDGQYFDLDANIQSFTNYNGSYVWKLIYDEICLQGHSNYDEMCYEQKILVKIISGLHTSISTHLSMFYKNIPPGEPTLLADLKTDSNFYFNELEYQKRVLDFPDRVQNLMLLYSLVAAALNAAKDELKTNFTIYSGNLVEDDLASQSLNHIIKAISKYRLLSPTVQKALNTPIAQQYQTYVHNLSRILNCVECEKCRLFGKMQTYGIGTALKILLGYPYPYKRNEIVALLNLMNKVSMSAGRYFKSVGHKTLKGQRDDQWTIFTIWATVCISYLLFVEAVYRSDIVGRLKKRLKQARPYLQQLKVD